MSNINNIGHYLGVDMENIMYISSTNETKGKILSEILSNICKEAREIDILTGGRNVDIDMLLGIEGSYIIGLKDGEFVAGETSPPSELYAESLFPSLDNFKGIDIQVIEEDEEIGEFSTDTDDEGYAAEDTAD